VGTRHIEKQEDRFAAGAQTECADGGNLVFERAGIFLAERIVPVEFLEIIVLPEPRRDKSGVEPVDPATPMVR
jgi:hypothetical protein